MKKQRRKKKTTQKNHWEEYCCYWDDFADYYCYYCCFVDYLLDIDELDDRKDDNAFVELCSINSPTRTNPTKKAKGKRSGCQSSDKIFSSYRNNGHPALIEEEGCMLRTHAMNNRTLMALLYKYTLHCHSHIH